MIHSHKQHNGLRWDFSFLIGDKMMLKTKLSKKAEFVISTKSGKHIFLLVTAKCKKWFLVNRNMDVLATTSDVTKTTIWRAENTVIESVATPAIEVVAPIKKFAVQTTPTQQPIRVDATTLEKAREIAEGFFGSIHDAYQLFDWVQSPAMLAETVG